jgi:hypothetical protein
MLNSFCYTCTCLRDLSLACKDALNVGLEICTVCYNALEVGIAYLELHIFAIGFPKLETHVTQIFAILFQVACVVLLTQFHLALSSC